MGSVHTEYPAALKARGNVLINKQEYRESTFLIISRITKSTVI